MAHGGTNFGFLSGANTDSNDESAYKPDLTSYDYVSIYPEFQSTLSIANFEVLVSKYLTNIVMNCRFMIEPRCVCVLFRR